MPNLPLNLEEHLTEDAQKILRSGGVREFLSEHTSYLDEDSKFSKFVRYFSGGPKSLQDLK